VAVSQFDLARVYECEKKFDSGILFANKAFLYWQQNEDTLRLLGIECLLCHLYLQLNEMDKAEQWLQQAEKLNAKPKLHWQPQIDFYFVAALLYKKKGMQEKENLYTDLYRRKIEGLKSQNINARAYYDQ
jgi:hypothetical protein